MIQIDKEFEEKGKKEKKKGFVDVQLGQQRAEVNAK